ncbi:flagellar basal-body rod protein FlgG [Pseudoalteromonas sp. BSi20480]|nr:flagellar basal-body rod protein FlgG [Pseudoalteromonas sp. BSi20480]
MNPALWISKTGLDAQQTDISVISNNLANASTVGYKKAALFLKIYFIKILTSQVGDRRKTLKCRLV